MANIKDLKDKAAAIKGATVPESVSAPEVGGLFEDVIDFAGQAEKELERKAEDLKTDLQSELWDISYKGYKSATEISKGVDGYAPDGSRFTLTSQGYYFYRFSAKKGDKFKLTFTSTVNNKERAVVSLEKDGQFVRCLYIGEAAYVNGYILEFEVTDDCDKIVVLNGNTCPCQRNEVVIVSTIDKMKEHIDELDNDVKDLSKNLYVVSDFNPVIYIDRSKKGYNPDGTESVDEIAAGYYFYYYNAKKGDRFRVTLSALVTNVKRAVVSLEKDGRFVKCLYIGDAAYVTGYVLEFEVTDDCDKIVVMNGTSCDTLKQTKTPLAEYVKSIDVKMKIKIVHFGNSFTQDSVSYVPAILKKIAPQLEFVIGMAYIGGCPLVQHCANFTGQTQVLSGSSYSPASYYYAKFESSDESWRVVGDRFADDIIKDEDWDVVTFQQNGGAAYQSWDIYYKPYIYKLQNALFSMVKNVKLGWLLTHGSYGEGDRAVDEQHWSGTAVNSEKVMDLTAIEVVFPYGTAVQNLRTVLDVGDTGDLLADKIHLQEGIGCLTAAYANALAALKCAGIECVSVIGDKTRPTLSWCTEIGVQSPHYGSSGTVVGVSDRNIYLAQVAAVMAMKKPYEKTDCSNF